MPTTIAVWRDFSVQPLLDITDPTFAHWYSLGVFWALYGDYQGTGPYEDRYVIDNIDRNIRAGRYDNPASSELPPSGFYFGMIHGGMIDPSTSLLRPIETMVALTDPEFTEGYRQGRQHSQQLTDSIVIQLLHQWGAQRVTGQALAYELGWVVGTLSHALSLATMPVISR